jgi:hypothetical protein
VRDVLHVHFRWITFKRQGKVVYLLQTNLQTTLSASARSDVIARIAKVFAIKETEIGLTHDGASFVVAASRDAKTLAIAAPA